MIGTRNRSGPIRAGLRAALFILESVVFSSYMLYTSRYLLYSKALFSFWKVLYFAINNNYSVLRPL